MPARWPSPCSRDSGPGERVILACPSGPEYLVAFIGCLYAGMVAVPAYPVEGGNSARSLTKLQSIAADCQAAALLVAETSPEQDAMYTALPVLAELPRIGAPGGDRRPRRLAGT